MKRIFLTAVLGLFVFALRADAQEAESLYWRYEGKSVKAHVAEPVDATKDKKIAVTALRTEIEKTLTERKSIRFEIASKETADLTVEITVNDYLWTDQDPIDMVMGVGAAAYDAATRENYAKMEAAVTVLDGKGRKLWADKLVATVTDNTMTESDGPTRTNVSMAKIFMKEAFSKKRASTRHR